MPPIDLKLVITTILSIAAPLLKQNLPRQEIIQRLLAALNLQPTTPHDDFDEIYVRTLIVYGIGKQPEALDLFHHPTIRNAFHRTYNTANRAILLNEAETLLDWNIIGDQCRAASIDAQREFDEFALLFNNI